jgi:hypothetical protein
VRATIARGAEAPPTTNTRMQMRSSVWFIKPGVHGDCLLIAGIPTAIAESLVNSLGEEFPNHEFWMEQD